MIELGASTLGFRHNTLDEALQAIKAQGFHAVDVCAYPNYCPHINPVTATQHDVQELKQKLADLGLSVAAVNAGDGRFGSSEHHAHAVTFTRAALDMAAVLGAYAVTTQSGIEPAPEQWDTVAQQIAPDLRALGDYAASLGLDLTLELHKSMLMANSQDALKLMQTIDHPNVGVALDPSHITYAGEYADEVALKLEKHVRHVHLRDGIDKNIMVVPGDGVVDFTALAAVLEAIGYNRVAVIELEYEHALVEQVTPDLARAKIHLEKCFQAVSGS